MEQEDNSYLDSVIAETSVDMGSSKDDESYIDSVLQSSIDLPVSDDLDYLDQVIGKDKAAQPHPDLLQNDQSFSADVSRSIDNMQASLGGFGQTIGELVGSESLQKWGMDFVEKQRSEAARLGQPTTKHLVDIEKTGDLTRWAQNQAAGAIASLPLPLASAGGGFLMGGPVGGLLGLAIGSLPLTTGEVQNAIKELNPDAKNPLLALTAGGVNAALNVIPAQRIMAPIVERLGAKFVINHFVQQGVPKAAATKYLADTLTVGSVGAIQSAVTQGVAHGVSGEEADTREFMANMIDAGVGTALMKTALDAPVAAVAKSMDNGLAPGKVSMEELKSEPSAAPLTDKINIINTLQGRSTDLLEPLKVYSPSFNKVLDHFRKNRDEPGYVSDVVDLKNSSSLIGAEFKARLADITHAIKNKEEFFDAYSRGDRSSESLLQLETLLSDFRTRAKDADLSVGKVPNFLPFIPDKTKILKQRDEFITDIAPYVADARAKATEYFNKLETPHEDQMMPRVERLFDGTDTVEAMDAKYKDKFGEFKYKVGQGKVPPKYGHLEANRQFADVPQHVLNKWGLGNPETNLKDYFVKGAHRIAYAEAFGPSGHKLNSMILEGIKENADNNRPVLKSEIDRIYNLADAYNHQYGEFENKTAKNLVGVVKTIGVVKSLPLSLLSSLVEPLNMAAKAGTIRTMHALVPTLHEMGRSAVSSSFRNIPKTEFNSQLSAAGLTLDSATHIMAARIGDPTLSKFQANVLEKYFKINGLTYWTQFMRTWSAKIADNSLKEDLVIARYSDPTSIRGRAAVLRLADMGIDPQKYWEVATPKERAKMETRAIRTFVSDTVLEPGFADKPQWMVKQGYMSLFTILKGYPVMFSNTVLPVLFNRFLPGKAGAAMRARNNIQFQSVVNGLFMFGAYATIYSIQDALRQSAKQGTVDYEDDRTDEEYFLDMLDRTVAPMALSYATNAYRAASFGAKPSETVAGPVVGMADDTFGAATGIIKDFERDVIGDTGGKDDKEKLELLNDWLLDVTPAGSFKGWWEDE